MKVTDPDAGDFAGFRGRGGARCRYYGMSGVALAQLHVLVSCSGNLPGLQSNSCALVADAHSPCHLERIGVLPDETCCPRAIDRFKSGERP